MSDVKELIALSDLEWRYDDAKERLEGLAIHNDEDYEQVCVLAKAIAVTEKQVKDTDVQHHVDELKSQMKPLQDQLKNVSDKLSDVKSICRSHIGAYAARQSHNALSEAQEKALIAAIELGDESYLDLVQVDEDIVPKVSGITFANVTDFKVVDEEAIPDKFKKIDTSAIRKVVQALGHDHDIPGVEVFSKQQVRVSGGK